MMQTLIWNFRYKWSPYCNFLIEPHWVINKEAICVQMDFQNLSGGACQQNNRFDQSDSSSVTHAQKSKTFVINLVIGNCWPSYVG